MLANGLTSIVECVVKTNISSNTQTNNLIKLNDDLHLTYYHPVKINNSWCFPKDILFGSNSDLYCDAIYSIVLELDMGSESSRGYGSGILIGNIECTTLGHGIN